MKKLISGLITIATIMFVLMVGDIRAYAEEIVIDGQYEDWNEDDMISVDSYFFSKVSMKVENDTLYIYGKEKAVNEWEKFFTHLSPEVYTTDNRNTNFVFREGTVSNGITQIMVHTQIGNYVVEGAQGIRTKNDTYEFEVAIPIYGYSNVSYVKMETNYGMDEIFVPVIGGSEDESTTRPEVETESGTVEEITEPTDGIVVDGDFSEWDAYPHTLVTNWNMPEHERTEMNCRSLGMFLGEDNLYVHIKMIGGWVDRFNGNQYQLSIDEYNIELYLFMKDGTVLPNWSLADGEYELNVFYKHGTPDKPDATQIFDAEAILVQKEGQPDEVEIKIPLEIFDDIFNTTFEDIKEVTIHNPNIFDHGMSTAGSSTAPFVGVALCAVSVVGGTAVYKKKKKLM